MKNTDPVTFQAVSLDSLVVKIGGPSRGTIQGQPGEVANAEGKHDGTQAHGTTDPAATHVHHGGYGRGDRSWQRQPRTATARGEPALAYLVYQAGESGFQLRIVPIRFAPESGYPYAREADSRTLAEGCLPTAPAASPDGRWITVFRTAGRDLRVERIAISDRAGSELTSSDRPLQVRRLRAFRLCRTNPGKPVQSTPPTGQRAGQGYSPGEENNRRPIDGSAPADPGPRYRKATEAS